MEREKQEAVLEAVLFTMGESVELGKLAEVIGESKENTKAILYEMQEKLNQSNRGISLMELEDSFQLCTKSEMYEYLIKIAKRNGLVLSRVNELKTRLYGKNMAV